MRYVAFIVCLLSFVVWTILWATPRKGGLDFWARQETTQPSEPVRPVEPTVKAEPEIIIVPEVKPPVVIVEVPVPKARPVIKASKPKPKPKVRVIPTDEISCDDARRGVGLPCNIIRSYSYIYEAYTPAQKRHVQSCLTPAEREEIAICFRQ